MKKLLWIIGLAAFAAVWIASPSRAACDGRDLRAGLTDAERHLLLAVDSETRYPRGRYFAVERDGARSIVFGTFHAAMPGIVLPPGLRPEIEAARLLFVEATQADQTALMNDMAANPGAILNPEGPYLMPEFTPEEWLRLTDALAEAGFPRVLANQIEPWLAALSLMIPPCAKDAARGPGLDRQIEDIATRAGLTIRSIERPSSVFRSLASRPFAQQIEDIRIALSILAYRDDGIETTRVLYAEGAIMQVWTINELLVEREYGPSARANLASLFEAFVSRRNRAWIDTALPELAKGDVIVAVGALHLPGDTGVLHLLEQEGFTVTPLDE